MPPKEKILSTRGLNAIKTSACQNNFLIIGVSVGSEKFEGEFLLALVKSINLLFKLDKVRSCVIVVADTLQRYNYMIDGKTTEETAFGISERAGDAWITKNIEILEKLESPYEITKWNAWLKSDSYKEAASQITNLLATCSAFESAVLESITEFSSRFKNRYEQLGFENPINVEDLRKNCRSYLLEECAIIMHLWPLYEENSCQYVVYPGKMTKALGCTYQEVVNKKDLFKWVHYSFKRILCVGDEASQGSELNNRTENGHPLFGSAKQENSRVQFFLHKTNSQFAGSSEIANLPMLKRSSTI